MMRLTGAIIALVAGILGLLAAFDTIRIGQLASAFGDDGGVVALGYAGALLSIGIIVLGAVAIGVKEKKWPAISIIISSVLAALFGGTWVAICMVLAFIGGVLILFDKDIRVKSKNEPDNPHKNTANGLPEERSKLPKILAFVGLGFVALLALIMIIPMPESTDANAPASTEVPKNTENTLHVSHHSATVGDFEVQIDAVNFTDRVGASFFEEQANNGELYVTGVLSYKNIGDRPISTFGTPDLHLIDANGNRYDPNIGISAAYATELDVNQNVLSDINPGITHQDSSVFVVAESLFDPELWKYEVVSGRESIIFSISPSFILNQPTSSEPTPQAAKVQPSRATAGAPLQDPVQTDYEFLLVHTWSEVSMEYVRSKLGVAKKIDRFTKAGVYEFGECIILIKGDTTVGFLEFSSACDGKWKNLIFNWNTDEKFAGSTLGDLMSYFGASEINGCIQSCGNFMDPEITLSVEGSRADGFIQLELISVQDDELTIDRVNLIETYANANGVEAYSLEELKGTENQAMIYNALKDVPVDRVRLGSY